MPKRPRTDFKLEEAKFFHAHLERDWRHVPNFEFYLSAFISAARSVTWVMRYEYGKREGWEDWFAKRQPAAHLRETLKKMNDLRVRSTKTEPVRTRTTITLNIPPDQVTAEVERLLRPNSGQQVKIVPTDATNMEAHLIADNAVVAKGRIERVTHEVPEFEGRDTLDVCRSYLHELEGLVKECETQFGA